MRTEGSLELVGRSISIGVIILYHLCGAPRSKAAAGTAGCGSSRAEDAVVGTLIFLF